MAAGDADDEQSDEDDAEVEVAPIGPLPDDYPILLSKSKIPLYCTSCHQDVLVIRFNICPKCTCTDSTLPLNHWITKSCRDSPIVNDQYILSTKLKDAIAHDVRERILARMKLEPGEERLPLGLTPRVPHRLVGMADEENLIYSCMPH